MPNEVQFLAFVAGAAVGLTIAIVGALLVDLRRRPTDQQPHAKAIVPAELVEAGPDPKDWTFRGGCPHCSAKLKSCFANLWMWKDMLVVTCPVCRLYSKPEVPVHVTTAVRQANGWKQD